MAIELPLEQPPFAVDLGARALALGAIADYLNYAAKTKGAEHGHVSSTELYYMRKRLGDLRAGFDEGNNTLAATDVLRARGADEGDVELHRIAMQAEVNGAFGLRVPHADAIRERVVRRAQRAARHLQ